MLKQSDWLGQWRSRFARLSCDQATGMPMLEFFANEADARSGQPERLRLRIGIAPTMLQERPVSRVSSGAFAFTLETMTQGKVLYLRAQTAAERLDWVNKINESVTEWTSGRRSPSPSPSLRPGPDPERPDPEELERLRKAYETAEKEKMEEQQKRVKAESDKEELETELDKKKQELLQQEERLGEAKAKLNAAQELVVRFEGQFVQISRELQALVARGASTEEVEKKKKELADTQKLLDEERRQLKEWEDEVNIITVELEDLRQKVNTLLERITDLEDELRRKNDELRQKNKIFGVLTNLPNACDLAPAYRPLTLGLVVGSPSYRPYAR